MSISDAEKEVWFDAAITGNTEKLQELLEINNDFINIETPNGETALIWAAQNGNVGLIKTLLEKGAYVNHQDNDGTTALIITSYQGCFDGVKVLLQYKPSVAIKDVFGKNAFEYAIETGHFEIEQMIEEYMNGLNGNDEIIDDDSYLVDGNNNINDEINDNQTDKKITDQSFQEGILDALKNAGPWKDLLMAVYNN